MTFPFASTYDWNQSISTNSIALCKMIYPAIEWHNKYGSSDWRNDLRVVHGNRVEFHDDDMETLSALLVHCVESTGHRWISSQRVRKQSDTMRCNSANVLMHSTNTHAQWKCDYSTILFGLFENNKNQIRFNKSQWTCPVNTYNFLTRAREWIPF